VIAVEKKKLKKIEVMVFYTVKLDFKVKYEIGLIKNSSQLIFSNLFTDHLNEKFSKTPHN